MEISKKNKIKIKKKKKGEKKRDRKKKKKKKEWSLPTSVKQGDQIVFKIPRVETQVTRINLKKNKEVQGKQTRHTSLRLDKGDDSSVWS